MKKENKLEIIKPFGPSVGVTNLPNILIDKINTFVDEVAKDEVKSKELDMGRDLAGQVTQEILLPDEIIKDELYNFIKKATKTYIQYLTSKEIQKFDFIKVWVVRQFQNEYNPIHWHNGHISGAGYLKLPTDFGSSKHPEKKGDFHGNINFVHGTRQFLSNSIMTSKPEIGKIYIFPNYMMHSVNPFYGEGERRSISFNANIDQSIFDIYSR